MHLRNLSIAFAVSLVVITSVLGYFGFIFIMVAFFVDVPYLWIVGHILVVRMSLNSARLKDGERARSYLDDTYFKLATSRSALKYEDFQLCLDDYLKKKAEMLKRRARYAWSTQGPGALVKEASTP